MRMVHTSDWHLGRSFHGVGLLPAQAAYVDHLVDLVRRERVDALVVSGDVYDRALPAPDTVALLSEAVTRLVDTGAQVVLSSGNHDSAIRLGFAAGLLERSGLHIRSSVSGIARPVVVEGVAVYAVPYLEPSQVADALGTEARTHPGVLTAAMDAVRADVAVRGLPCVVMAHAFVAGGAPTDSERDIAVGGVSVVHPDVFAGVDYAALGHLHRPQQVADAVRYSGSPVAMSFSEAGHRKVSLLVEVDERGLRQVAEVEAPVERPIALLRGDLEELLADPRHAAAESAWVQVTLTDRIRPAGAMERLRARFPYAVELRFEPTGAPTEISTYAARMRSARSEVDVCCDFLGHVRGGVAASDAERQVLVDAVEAARLARADADDRVPSEGRRSGAA
ncbi:putative exonuclease [Nostocoides japonicum T1-X7]|uniref:Nuclease SbcCD subunit D n=1 Tax=Nostocoides japonicum T1-X7 TaxID=1194083 RepID=A0A077LUL9_9MICO|nr:exonuclease SbcCD subunit D [Tetrasphaera japonica]CCH76372.1 putative exonuclease [Tetrasphaera japonica T1-X7]